MPRLNVQQNNQNIIKAFQVALETSHKNLLDNAYFVGGGSQLGDGIFPVNQRGQTSYTGGGTTFDRWRLSSGGSMTLAPEGVSVNGLMYQKKVLDLTVGDTYTLSRRNTDGTIVSVTGIVPSAEGWAVGNQNFGVYFRPSTKVCDIQICGEYFLQAIKLEKGSVSTLANDVPPDFGEELRKCQRYFLRLKATGYNYIPIASGVWTSVSTVRMLINTPVPMRAVPTISHSGTFKCAGNGTILDVSALGALTITEQGVFANVLTNGSPVPWQYYTLLMLENAYIDLSADL